MAVNLVTVTGNLETLIGSTPSLGRIWFKMNRPSWNLAGDIFAPEYVEAIADSVTGAFSIALQSTDDLEVDATYTAILLYRDAVDGKDKEYRFAQFVLPVGGPYQLGDLLIYPAPENGVLGDLAFLDTITASLISDSTTAGRALLTAANAGAQRTALGATTVGGAVFTAADGEAARLALEITAPPEAINQLDNDASFSGSATNLGGVSGAVLSTDGMWQLVIGPYTLQIGFGDYMRPPGVIQDGAVTNVTKSGEYWQYRADGVQFLVHDAYPEYTPGLMDTTVIDIALRNGQSWNTQIRLPVDLNNEDPTGYTRKRMDNYRTAEFVVPRCELDFSPRIPWDNRAIKRRAYSNDGAISGSAGPVTGLRLWEPGVSRTYNGGSEVDFFTIGDITSLSRQHFLRELRLPRHALVSVQAGRAGTSEEYFLASGSSFAGSGGTVNAAILAGNANYFFTNDTIALAETAAIIEADWFDKPVTYSVETFDQGGAGTTQTADDDHFFNFLTARRADVNSRALPCLDGTTIPWLIVPIGFAASKETDQGYQAVDQCRWSDANAGGKDLAVGPFYHLKLLQESVGQSAIHGTAMHNLRKGEMMGLVEACVISPAWGRVDRFKISGVNHYPGNNKFTLTVNSPVLASGLPLIATDEVPAATAYGFTVKKASNGTVVPVTVTVTGQSYIDVTYTAGALAGETAVLLDYAGFGVAQSDAVVGKGTQSACWGNIKKAGRFIGPISLQPIDFYLSPYRDIVTL